MEKLPKLYRKRYFPDELIHLKDDIIRKHTNDLIITQWNTLKPRKDISRGISAYFPKEGYKISKIINASGQLVYWYCDIIETEYIPEQNTYIFHDLLIDVLVLPDGQVRVVDLEELADFLLQSSSPLTPALCAKALRITDSLLKIIYSGNFHTLQNKIEEME